MTASLRQGKTSLTLVAALCALFAFGSGIFTAFAQTSAPPKPAAAAKPEKELLAVLDLEGVDTTKSEATAMTERLREEMLRTGRVTLVDRSQMNSVLEEQALQQSGCTSQECAVKVGKVLGVKKLVSGKVIKLSDQLWQVSAMLVDVETAETIRADSIRHRGDLFSLLDTAIVGLAVKLSPAPAGTTAPVAATSSAAAPVATPIVTSTPPPAAHGRVWAPSETVRLAVFPSLFGGGTGGGGLSAGPWIIDALAPGVRSVPNTTVSYSWYPRSTQGASLTDDKNLPDRIRSGFFKSLNTAQVVAKAKELGIDGVLTVDANGAPLKVSVVLVPADGWKVYESSAQFTISDSGTREKKVANLAKDVIEQFRNGQ